MADRREHCGGKVAPPDCTSPATHPVWCNHYWANERKAALPALRSEDDRPPPPAHQFEGQPEILRGAFKPGPADTLAIVTAQRDKAEAHLVAVLCDLAGSPHTQAMFNARAYLGERGLLKTDGGK